MSTITRPAEAGATKAQATYLLIALIAAYIISFVDRQILALLVTPIKADLGLSDFEMGLLQGLAFALCFCLAGLPLGWAVDRWQRRRLIFGGIGLWSVATVLCGLSSSFWQLFLARMLVGIGEAVLTPAAYSMLTDAFKPEHAVRAISSFTMAGLLGVGFAFLAGGTVIDAITSIPTLPLGLRPWQAAFLLVGAPGVLVALLFLRVVEPVRRGGSDVAVTAVGQQLVSLWQQRGVFLPMYVTSMFLATLAYGGFVWMPTHLIRAFGMDAPDVGYVLGVTFLVAAPLGALGGTALTEMFQRRRVSAAPMRTVLLIAIFMLPLGLAPAIHNFPVVIAAFAVLAFSQAAYYGNLVTHLQQLTPPRLRGLNSAIFILVTNIGSMAIGMALIGAISDSVFPDRPDGIGVTLAAVNAAAASLAIVFAYLTLRRSHNLEVALVTC